MVTEEMDLKSGEKDFRKEQRDEVRVEMMMMSV